MHNDFGQCKWKLEAMGLLRHKLYALNGKTTHWETIDELKIAWYFVLSIEVMVSDTLSCPVSKFLSSDNRPKYGTFFHCRIVNAKWNLKLIAYEGRIIQQPRDDWDVRSTISIVVSIIAHAGFVYMFATLYNDFFPISPHFVRLHETKTKCSQPASSQSWGEPNSEHKKAD